mmetsp:Transcript_1426/g.5532  ORF Transcript_1426/g.5532 Transcript_1426/m.5532 type:complete len:196 (-) Transcript_1426:1346-1933(-)
MASDDDGLGVYRKRPYTSNAKTDATLRFLRRRLATGCALTPTQAEALETLAPSTRDDDMAIDEGDARAVSVASESSSSSSGAPRPPSASSSTHHVEERGRSQVSAVQPRPRSQSSSRPASQKTPHAGPAPATTTPGATPPTTTTTSSSSSSEEAAAPSLWLDRVRRLDGGGAPSTERWAPLPPRRRPRPTSMHVG